MAVLGSLRAEDEPWLSACFVPPPEFERVFKPQSVIVFGDPGSGKTALYRALQMHSLHPGSNRPMRLLVDWRPGPLLADARPDLAWVKRQADQVLDACAVALASHLVRYPEDYDRAPGWAQARFVWFIRRFTLGDPAVRLGPLAEGASVLRRILDAPVQDVLYDDAAPDQKAAELARALQPLGLEGIWVMGDGLEGWAEAASEHLIKSLGAFLSTLALFERSGLVFKWCLPSHLEPALGYAGGVARRRVDSIRIQWDAARLRSLVERRLALAVGQERFDLTQLCRAPKFLAWLEWVGGTSPREWLDQVAPLLERYLEKRRPAPIDEAAWKKLRRERPPRVRLDDAGRKLFVGGHEIRLEDVPASAYDMLRYLYDHGGQVVTKAELYFLAYRHLDRVPRSPADEDYEAPEEYRGLVDTNIWRLRKAIEPDPSDPILLITRRGHGLTLQVRL